MKDPASAGLSAEEDHLLGCVDGSLSEDELSFVTGKAPEQIAAMLDRLVEHGRQSAARLQEMREHSWEHDARTGQRLYRPVLQTAGTAPPTAEGSPPRESEPSASGGDV